MKRKKAYVWKCKHFIFNDHESKKSTVMKEVMKRKMHEENEIKADCQWWFKLQLYPHSHKEKKKGGKKAVKLRGHFITGNKMKGTGCNLIEAHTDI